MARGQDDDENDPAEEVLLFRAAEIGPLHERVDDDDEVATPCCTAPDDDANPLCQQRREDAVIRGSSVAAAAHPVVLISDNGSILWQPPSIRGADDDNNNKRAISSDFQSLVYCEWGSAIDGSSGAAIERASSDSVICQRQAPPSRPLTALERPAVAHRITGSWKSRNGRFLQQLKEQSAASNETLVEEETGFREITDDRILRSIVGKLLKQLGSSIVVEDQGQQNLDSLDSDALLVSPSPGTESLNDHGLPPPEPAATTSADPLSDRLPPPPTKRVSATMNYARRQGRLYGREKEQLHLFSVYRRLRNPLRALRHDDCEDSDADTTDGVAPCDDGEDDLMAPINLVVISGESGVGKSSLALTLQPVAYADQAFFVRGKFESTGCVGDDSTSSLSTAEPLAAFCHVLTDLTRQLLDLQDEALRDVQDRIDAVVGEDAQLLVNMAPALHKVFRMEALPSFPIRLPDDDDDDTTFGSTSLKPRYKDQGSHAARRLEYVFRRFLRAVASPAHPIVILLDDVQWADPIAVEFLESLLTDTESQGIMIIVTTRPDTSSRGQQRLEQAVSQYARQQAGGADNVATHRISLLNLDEDDIHRILRDLLVLPTSSQRQLASNGADHQQQVGSLAKTIFELTKGNIYFFLEVLRSLQQDGSLEVDEESKQWKLDGHGTPAVLEAKNLRDLMRTKILDLPDDLQETLKMAACLGSRLERGILSELVAVSPDLGLHLEAAADASLLVECDHLPGRYIFAHDSIQQAAYELIPPDEREAFHLKIAKRLWRKLRASSPDFYLFAVLQQLFLAEKQIADDDLRSAVASLCLTAGQKSVKQTGFQAAAMYLQRGIQFLGPQMWRANYDLTLQLFNAAAEACCCVGQFARAEELIDEVLKRARVQRDSIQARTTRLFSLTTQGAWPKAIESGLDTLKLLGESLPRNPTLLQVIGGLTKARFILRGRSNASILRLPRMTDTTVMEAMQIYNLMFLAAYYSRPRLAALIAFRMIAMSIDQGLSVVSPVGFAMYAAILCGGGQKVEEGYRYGQLAHEMVRNLKADAWLCRVLAIWNGCVRLWREPVKDCVGSLKDAHSLGLRMGDVEFAALNASLYVWTSLESLPLPQLDAEIHKLWDRLVFLGQGKNLAILRPTWQMIQNFRGLNRTGTPTMLSGKKFDLAAALDPKTGNPTLIRSFHLYSMILCYHFSEFAQAEEHSRISVTTQQHYSSKAASLIPFYHCLCMLAAAANNPTRNGLRKRVAAVRRHVKEFRRWSALCPENYLGKLFLIEAELAALRGDRLAASSKYYCAVVHARVGGLLMQEALANERAGLYHLRAGESELGANYLAEAFRLYEKWDGLAKLEHLRAEVALLTEGTLARDPSAH